MLSLAVPLNVSAAVDVVKVLAEVGPVIVTIGAVASAADVIVHANVWEAVSTPSETVAFTLNVPAVVGVPGATERIRTGQTITVDGSAGTVSLSP